MKPRRATLLSAAAVAFLGLWSLGGASALCASEAPSAAQLRVGSAVSKATVSLRHFYLRLGVDMAGSDSRGLAISVSAPDGSGRCVVQLDERHVRVYSPAPNRTDASRLTLTRPCPEGLRQVTITRLEDRLRIYAGRAEVLSEVLPSAAALVLRVYSAKRRGLRIQKTGPHVFRDDFARTELGRGDGWERSGGAWGTEWHAVREASPNPFVCSGAAPAVDSGVLTTGHAFWNNYAFSTAVHVEDRCDAGLVFGWSGRADHLSATLATSAGLGRLLLQRVSAAGTTIVTSQPVTVVPRNWYRLGVEVREGAPVTVSLDGNVLITADPGTPCFGRIGLLVGSGRCRFDDVSLVSPPPPPGLRPMTLLAGISKAYEHKPYDRRDGGPEGLARWSTGAGSWVPRRLPRARNGASWGRDYHLPLFGDFELRFPTGARPCTLTLAEVTGDPLAAIALQHGVKRAAKTAASVLVDGRVVKRGLPDIPVVVGVRDAAGRFGSGPTPAVYSANVQQDFFENAPVDWLGLSGDWDTTARWQCEPRWSFYGGVGRDAVIQFSRTRFEGDQVHELYYGMKDILNRDYQRRRYGRHDVNFSFMTDGRDLFSGYTVLFGGHGNRGTYLYRGRVLVATNPEAGFEPFRDIHDLHVRWRRLRYECVQGRVRVFVGDRLLFDYRDSAGAFKGGHVALWTYRNGVVYARLNSSARRIAPAQSYSVWRGACRPDTAAGAWRALTPALVSVRRDAAARWWSVENRFGGGSFAAEHTLSRPVDLATSPRLSFAAVIPEGVRVNLHVRASGCAFVVPLTAPVGETYWTLVSRRPFARPWEAYAIPALTAPYVCGEPAPSVTEAVSIDLLAEVRSRFPGLRKPVLERLVVGNSSHRDYLMAGLSGNAAGSVYKLGPVRFAANTEVGSEDDPEADE